MAFSKAQELQKRLGSSSVVLGRDIRDWSYPVYLLTRRVFVVVFGVGVLLLLPLHAFLSEGPHIDAVWDSAIKLVDALGEAIKARPVVAIGGLLALVVTGRQIIRVHLSKSKVREIIETYHEYVS